MGVSRLDCAPGLDPTQLLFWTGTEPTLKLLDPFGPFWGPNLYNLGQKYDQIWTEINENKNMTRYDQIWPKIDRNMIWYHAFVTLICLISILLGLWPESRLVQAGPGWVEGGPYGGFSFGLCTRTRPGTTFVFDWDRFGPEIIRLIWTIWEPNHYNLEQKYDQK